MTSTRANLIVGQSGGPTPVVNASLVGVIEEALRSESIDGIYGMRHGVEGLLREDLVDLRAVPKDVLDRIRQTPSAALGSCRTKLSSDDDRRLLQVLRAHDIRFFLYIGGEGSAQASHRLARLAADEGYDLQVIAIPKTIDNDLPETDHCPGFPSVARWLAVSVREAGLDTEAIGVVDRVKVIETMGRDTGWIAASTALARQREDDAPHLIYLPERPFRRERFLADVEGVHRKRGRVVITVCEGLRDDRGQYLAASGRAVDADPMGRPQLGGVAEVLCDLIATGLGLKARFDKPGTIQRVSAALTSPVDLEEAYRVGQAAVQAATTGHTDEMVSIVRESSTPYHSTTRLVPLAQVAGRVRAVPDEYIGGASNDVTAAFVEYVMPLIGAPLADYPRLAAPPVRKTMLEEG